VLRRVSKFFRERQLTDLALLYFSGHGFRDDNGELYLTTSDTEIDDVEASSLSATFIRQRMEQSRAGQQVVLLDCCFSGAFLPGLTPKSEIRINSGESFNSMDEAKLSSPPQIVSNSRLRDMRSRQLLLRTQSASFRSLPMRLFKD
jgi:uncharacterized caspase-like protein